MRVALEVRPFTPAQIKLLETFADQAVIAIENVRLFKELQDRNRQLTEALEQQTATSEILRVIASSPTDIQPVLDVVAENASRLCEAADAQIFRVEGNECRIATLMDQSPFLDRPNRDRLPADYLRPGPLSTARLSTSMMSLLLKRRPSFQKTGLWLGRSEFGPGWLRHCSVKELQSGYSDSSPGGSPLYRQADRLSRPSRTRP